MQVRKKGKRYSMNTALQIEWYVVAALNPDTKPRVRIILLVARLGTWNLELRTILCQPIN